MPNGHPSVSSLLNHLAHFSFSRQNNIATASYRLMPTIDIIKPIPSALCHQFAECFAPGVIELQKDADGSYRASVSSCRRDTVSREVLRYAEFEESVILGRKRNHFICEGSQHSHTFEAYLIISSYQLT